MNVAFDSFRASIAKLKAFGVVPSVSQGLMLGSFSTAAALADQAMREVQALSDTRNPEIHPQLKAHLAAHCDAVAEILDGRPDIDFEFIKEHAAVGARQKFPLDAMLSIYRLMHPTLVEWIREAAIGVAHKDAELRRVVAAVSGFTSEYISQCSSHLTSTYVQETRRLAEAEGDRRSALFNLLIEGYDESDQAAARLLRQAGYLAQRQAYCVLAIQSVDAGEMDDEARVDRIQHSLLDCLSKTRTRVLPGQHDNQLVAIVSGTQRLSGWTAPYAALGDQLYEPLRLMGNAVLIGVSNDVPSTAHIPRAVKEAQQALSFSNVSERVLRYQAIPFLEILVAAAQGQVQDTLPSWTAELIARDRKSKGKLLATLRAYADNDMNLMRTSKALSVHANTIYARMHKIEELTGRNPLQYKALTELLLAADCAEA